MLLDSGRKSCALLFLQQDVQRLRCLFRNKVCPLVCSSSFNSWKFSMMPLWRTAICLVQSRWGVCILYSYTSVGCPAVCPMPIVLLVILFLHFYFSQHVFLQRFDHSLWLLFPTNHTPDIRVIQSNRTSSAAFILFAYIAKYFHTYSYYTLILINVIPS